MKSSRWSIGSKSYPVVTTGVRWPAMREGRASDDYFARFPECRNDPLRNDYGSARAFPDPFARGGGFFPVLLKMADGTLCCATRTGSCHAGSGGEISLSFSSDRGMKWTDYRAVARGDPDRNIDVRNPALGQAGNGDLVLAYGVMRGIDVRGRISTSDPYESIQVIRSSDAGVAWSDPETVPFPEVDLMLHPHGQMRCLSDGTLVFNARGFYTTEAYGRNPKLPARMSYLYRSRDDGKTWSDTTLVKSGGSETGFLALSEAHWLAYVRFNDGPNRIAHSYDGGKSWEAWVPVEPESGRRDDGAKGNSGAASPGSVAVLPNGKCADHVRVPHVSLRRARHCKPRRRKHLRRESGVHHQRYGLPSGLRISEYRVLRGRYDRNGRVFADGRRASGVGHVLHRLPLSAAGIRLSRPRVRQEGTR